MGSAQPLTPAPAIRGGRVQRVLRQYAREAVETVLASIQACASAMRTGKARGASRLCARRSFAPSMERAPHQTSVCAQRGGPGKRARSLSAKTIFKDVAKKMARACAPGQTNAHARKTSGRVRTARSLYALQRARQTTALAQRPASARAAMVTRERTAKWNSCTGPHVGAV